MEQGSVARREKQTTGGNSKKKKIGEPSEPSGGLGRGKDGLASS